MTIYERVMPTMRIDENDPFWLALHAIEPDYPGTSSGPAFSIDRAAALVHVPPRLLRAWIHNEYQFRTFALTTYEEFDILTFFRGKDPGPGRSRRSKHRIRDVLIYAISAGGIYRLKKLIDKEPRPFPPYGSVLKATLGIPSAAPTP